MTLNLLIAILSAAVVSAVPILFAAVGEIFSERAGVLNLGVEGVMLVGAVSGFAAILQSKSLAIGVLGALFAGLLLGLFFAFLTVTVRANQVVCGLALTIFGMGLSGYIGKPIIGSPSPVLVPKIAIPLLSEIPFIGPILFKQDIFVYAMYILVPIAGVYIYYTTAGLNLRAVGENPGAVDAAGLSVTRLRYIYVCVGSMLGSVGGAYLSLVYSPSWLENMTAGRGWIAVALVIFSRWDPAKALLGAFIFGGIDVLGLRLQAIGITIPSYFLRMLPYLFTIAVLILSTRNMRKVSPAALGKVYDREER